MKNGFNRFLSSTAIVPFPAHILTEQHSQPQDSGGIIIKNCEFLNFRTGIIQVIRHRAPKLSDDLLRLFNESHPDYITRHIEERFLPDARKGYFQFGTLIRYRAKEGALASRLGDHQESRIHEIFNSRSNFFEHANIGGTTLTNTKITGTDRQIVIETIVNDYCSCSSIGEFSLERGEALRDLETDPEKKPGAYVTYHLPTLKLALENYLRESDYLSELKILGRNVNYGDKDITWDVEQCFTYQPHRDALAIWLSITFIKSPSFKHEDEFRLLIVDPSGPGGLDDRAENFVIKESSSIAASIVISGVY